jgi:hypothetical protein
MLDREEAWRRAILWTSSPSTTPRGRWRGFAFMADLAGNPVALYAKVGG